MSWCYVFVSEHIVRRICVSAVFPAGSAHRVVIADLIPDLGFLSAYSIHTVAFCCPGLSPSSHW